MFATTSSLTDRFTWLLDELCKVIGADAHKRQVEAALAWAIWNHVRMLGERLIALIERAQAGRLRVRRSEAGMRGDRAEPRPAGVAHVPGGLPQDFGWMPRMLPQTAQFADVLSLLLRDRETVALVAQAPEAARILRPLCEMLGVKAPEYLRRRRGSGAEPAPALAAPGAGADALPARAERDDASGTAAPPDLPGAEAPRAEAVDGEAAAPPPPPPPPWPLTGPPPPAIAPESERARIEAYYKRPGGLYWDGRRWQWS
jgi:hypothetical protein